MEKLESPNFYCVSKWGCTLGKTMAPVQIYLPGRALGFHPWCQRWEFHHSGGEVNSMVPVGGPSQQLSHSHPSVFGRITYSLDLQSFQACIAISYDSVPICTTSHSHGCLGNYLERIQSSPGRPEMLRILHRPAKSSVNNCHTMGRVANINAGGVKHLNIALSSSFK